MFGTKGMAICTHCLDISAAGQIGALILGGGWNRVGVAATVFS